MDAQYEEMTREMYACLKQALSELGDPPAHGHIIKHLRVYCRAMEIQYKKHSAVVNPLPTEEIITYAETLKP